MHEKILMSPASDGGMHQHDLQLCTNGKLRTTSFQGATTFEQC